MTYTCSPAMNDLNIHVHVLSCAGPPRTVQTLKQVKICRQLTKRAYPVSCFKLPHAFPLYGSNYSCDLYGKPFYYLLGNVDILFIYKIL